MIPAPGDRPVPAASAEALPIESTFEAWRSRGFDAGACPVRNELERDGLLEREVFPTKPPSVRYSLSPLGRSVLSPVSALVAWAESSYPAIRTAQARFDAAKPQGEATA